MISIRNTWFHNCTNDYNSIIKVNLTNLIQIALTSHRQLRSEEANGGERKKKRKKKNKALSKLPDPIGPKHNCLTSPAIAYIFASGPLFTKFFLCRMSFLCFYTSKLYPFFSRSSSNNTSFTSIKFCKALGYSELGRYPIPLMGLSKMVTKGRNVITIEQLLQVSLAFYVFLTELRSLLRIN